MRSVLIFFFVYTFLAIMFASQTLYHSHVEQNITFDIYNFTENTLVWNYTRGEETLRNITSQTYGVDYSQLQSKRISNLIYKFVDFFGYSMVEFSKWAMEYGYTHPEYDFGYFMNLVKYWLFAMIIIALFPILIPLLALIYLAFVGANNLFKYLKMRLKKSKKPKP